MLPALPGYGRSFFRVQTIEQLLRRDRPARVSACPRGTKGQEPGSAVGDALEHGPALALLPLAGVVLRRRRLAAREARRIGRKRGLAGQALARYRVPESAAWSLPTRRPPAWVYIHGLKSPLSSTALRAKRKP